MALISVTMLSAYLYCKRKLFLERVLQIYEPEKEALVLGKVRHLIFDRISKAEKELVISLRHSSKKEIEDSYKKAYAKIARKTILESKKDLDKFDIDLMDVFLDAQKSLESEVAFRSGIVHDFLKVQPVFGEELWEKITPKIDSELYLESEKLQLKGIIDKIEVFEDYVVPVELKTGKAPAEGAWPGHVVQAAAYLLLLEEAGKKVPKAQVHYLDSKDKRDVFMNPYLKEEIIHLTQKVNDLLESVDLPDFCSQQAKCKACSLKNQCFAENYLNQRLKKLSESSQ